MSLTSRFSRVARWCALALALSMGAGGALAQKKVVLGYTAVPDFAAAFIAKERGFFARHGLDVDMQLYTLTPTLPPALYSNSVQIAGLTPTIFLQAADSGIDLVGLVSASTYDNTKGFIGLVVKADGGVQGPKDLVGKKIGVPGLNGTLHVLARYWLARKGVDVKQVTFVEVPLPQMADVLKGGSVDAVITAEPFVGRMKASGIGQPLPGFAADLPNGFNTVMYAATRSFATSNGATVKAFRDAIAEAVAFANSNRDDAYTELGKYFKVPPPVLKATPWPQLATDLTDAHLRFWVDTMREQAMLKKQPTLSSLIAR